MGSGEALAHARSSNTSISLIELIVEEQILLPGRIVDDTLVNILGTRERGDADDGALVANLVGDVVDGEGVLVVAVANILAVVALVGTAVDETLGVVNIAVLGSASRASDVGGVANVEENQSSAAGKVVSDTDSLVSTD